jgi:PhzF family phenazine biosynthesis protein
MANKNTQKIAFYWVDAFAKKPFQGNPAAVCILDNALTDQEMQKIANEIGLSETAFVEANNQIESEPRRLRWFTPKVEVKLCGHATLASASVLFNELKKTPERIVFETASGKLVAKKTTFGISLDFPQETFEPAKISPELFKAIGITKIVDTQYSPRLGMLLINIPSETELQNLKPDFEKVKQLQNKITAMGVIVTAQCNTEYDFASRFFAPQLGINEDPVTGSSHCILAPYWSKILHKTEMNAYQASARGGELKVRLNPNNRVEMIGNTTILLKGILTLPS